MFPEFGRSWFSVATLEEKRQKEKKKEVANKLKIKVLMD